MRAYYSVWRGQLQNLGLKSRANILFNNNKIRIIMSLQQKETYLCTYKAQKHSADSQSHYSEIIAISLPRVRQPVSRNKNRCFKEYQNGTKIINEIPLLLFNSKRKKSPRKDRFQRCKTEQKKQDNFESVSPFFKNYIRHSLSRRRYQQKTQNKTILSPKRLPLKVVSFDSQLPKCQTRKISAKNQLKKVDLTFQKYQASPKLKPLNINVNNSQNSQIQELKIQRKQIKLTKDLPRAIPHVKCKIKAQGHTSPKQAQIDVSPWIHNYQIENVD